MTEPTDAELEALLVDKAPILALVGGNVRTAVVKVMREAFAKWGTPPVVVGEPVAWGIFDSQGFYEVADSQESAERFCTHYNKRKGADPLKPYTAGPLYTTPPAQAQAGAVPLTTYEIRESIKKFKESENLMGVNHIHIARAIERAHGIK